MSEEIHYTTILIVDKNSENQKLLNTLLTEEGYNVITASSTTSVQKQAEKVKPSIILLNSKLQEINGFELCKKLKEHKEIKHSRIIFIHSAIDEEFITKGFEIGGDDYITKPIIKQEILTKIKNQIQLIKFNNHFNRARDNRNNIAIEEIPDGFWDWNLITNEAFFSNQYENMLGYESGELSGSIEAWLKLLHPEDKMKALETLLSYLNKETSKYETTFRMRNKNGNYRWIYSRGKAEFDKDGKVAVRIVGFNTDVTENKITEINQEKSYLELRDNIESIKKLNIKLNQAQKNFLKNDSLKTTLLTNISQEITPSINDIIDYSKLLEETDLSIEKKKQYIDSIQKNSNKVLNLIQDLIETSKTTTTQISHNFSDRIKFTKDQTDYSNSTILVAEDDDISYLFIKEILSKYGIKVIRAYNGKEALEIVSNNQNIDLILMDIKMPVMSGLDATKAIINTNKNIPIVAQTAYASDPDRKKVAAAGCVDYITKPIDKIEIKKVLEKYLKANIVSSL